MSISRMFRPGAFVRTEMFCSIGRNDLASGPAFRPLAGYSEEELKKRSFLSILSMKGGMTYRKALEFRQKFRVRNPYEVEMVCAIREKTKLAVARAPLHMPPGKVLRIVIARKGAKHFALPHTFGVLGRRAGSRALAGSDDRR